MKEIKDWATNLLISGFGPGERTIFEGTEDIKLFKVHLFKTITELRRLNREGMAFKYIDLPNWKGLVYKSKKLRRAIGVQVNLLDEYAKSIDDKDKFKAANEHRTKMNDIAESIIKEAQNIRSNFFKSK